MIRTHVSEISKIGRNTKGVILMRLRDGGKVAAVSLAPAEDSEPEAQSETAPDNTEEATEAVETVSDNAEMSETGEVAEAAADGAEAVEGTDEE